jgi:hypothetical protein
MSAAVPPQFPLLYDFSILNSNDTISKLGNLAVMSNHYKSLVEFLAGNFQKSQYVAAGSAVQIAGRFVYKLSHYPLMH